MDWQERKQLARYQLGCWSAAAALLVALACARAAIFRNSGQVTEYYQRVAEAAAASPMRFGSWISVNVPVPGASVTVIRPSAAISRAYSNLATGDQASFLLTESHDASELSGYFPPVRYKSRGFRAIQSAPRDWNVGPKADGGDMVIHGMSYTFASISPQDLTTVTVYNFIILPNGITCRDMDGASELASNPRFRPLGAAQVQVVFSAALPREKRDEIFLSLIRANQAAIDAVRAQERH